MFGLPHSRPAAPRSGMAHLWWLNPCWPLSLMLLSTGISAYIIPNADYVENWKTPKYYGAFDLEYVILCVAGFVISACFIDLVLERQSRGMLDNFHRNPTIPWAALWFVFYASFGLTMMAYIIWAGMSFASGLSVSDIVAALRNDQGAIYAIRDKTETLPGVTTFTQLEMGTCLLGILLGFKFGWRKHLLHLAAPLVTILVITCLRAQLREERIAVLEIIIPSAILTLVLLDTGRWRASLRRLLAFLPFLAPFGLYVYFAAAEYSRSWVNFYQDQGNSSFFWFSFIRLAGYYVTALNNGAAYVQTIGHYGVPYYSCEWFWKFPLVKALYPYESVTGVDPNADYADLLKRQLNQELNNLSGVFVTEVDFGFVFGIAAWCLVGIVAMFMYRAFRRGTLGGLLFYPFFYIGLLEVPRIYYWGSTHALATWVLLIGVTVMGLFAAQGDWRKRRSPGEVWNPRQNVSGLAGYQRAVRRGL